MKKSFKDVSFHAAVVLGSIAFFALVFAAYGKLADQAEKSRKGNRPTVVLDAGHGGEDGGAVGIDGTYEKNVNLAVAMRVRDLLEASGYEVITTRDEDRAIYDDGAGTLRQKKKSDLKNRLEIMKSNSGEKTIFLSVHQNKFPDSKYFGSQIFYSRNDPGSRELANYVRESIVGLIQPENTREIKPAEKEIYLLHNASVPAAVVECGFLSNPEEARKLNDPEYQDKMAFCIFCGVINYFTNL